MKAILLAALVTLAGASLVFAGSPAAPQTKAASTNAPPADTLGFIETRDRSIEIKAGDTGSYTVRTKDGKVLAERISASQLQAQFPQLHEIVRYGYARNTDASVNVVRSATWNNDASVSR